MNRRLMLLSAVAATSLALTGLSPLLSARAAEPQSAADLRAAMRKLWEDHITYTRNYIISALAGLPDSDDVAKRLLQNQDDIGDAVKPYYGDAAGQKLAILLKDHIKIATDVVKAAKSGRKNKLAAAQKKWTGNADDIAMFLSKANPNWSEQDLKEMLHKHLELTTGEVVGRLKRDWVADIKSYDEGHVHMLKFADMLTDGIAKQFADKFNG
ncbi:acetylglutamate kinase [Mesorhizobium sp.]|uniref:acetylglutamate kinase n=1 Tax=Mesorhizobium sp. TaxID=1871066 RepID=UPI0025BE85E0|nr:acetylglutamate kinase [Mesorhizobium sp.]